MTPIRGDYFAEGDYLIPDPAAGVLRDRTGADVLVLDAELLTSLHATLGAEGGPPADRVLKSCGRAWGRGFAERFARELGEHHGTPVAEWPFARFEACLASAVGHVGWGALTLDASRFDKGLLVATVRQGLGGDADAPPTNALLAGALAGMFSVFTGQELDALAAPGDAAGEVCCVLALPARLERVAETAARGAPCEQVLAELENVRL